MKRFALLLSLCLVLLAACSDDDETVDSTEAAEEEEVVYPTGDSPYIYEVLEFCPAPGQFVNSLPEYEDGDTEDDMIAKCTEYIAGVENGSLISLGTFGGYITFRFDHKVPNDYGSDIRIMGNGFLASADPSGLTYGGSFEPGIVQVSFDTNDNGLPDDEWYEIWGGAHDEGIQGYSITYYAPTTEEIVDDYIPYVDNQGNSGYEPKNTFHKQSYFPQWLDADSLTFTGTLLPDNAIDQSGNGTYWVLYQYRKPYGYVDEVPNSSDFATIDFDWAVDSDGNPANLKYVDFIRVYSAQHQQCGWLGETSTEIAGATDLHFIGDTIVVDTTFTNY